MLRFGLFCKLLSGRDFQGAGSPHGTISATGSSAKPRNLACFRGSCSQDRDVAVSGSPNQRSTCLVHTCEQNGDHEPCFVSSTERLHVATRPWQA